MTWRGRRQLLYIGAGGIMLLLIVGYFAYRYVTTPGSCYDRVQDDGEEAVDCGGPCARICAADTREPVVEWTRALPVATGTYDGVAYIENPQYASGAVAYNIGYTFELLGADNQLIISQSGTTDLPAVQNIPIIAPNISTGNKTAVRAQFSFTTSPIVWEKLPASDLPAIAVKNIDLAPNGSRLSADILNETNQPLQSLAVMAVLFDAEGNAVTASQSLVEEIDAEGSDTVVFTWPGNNAGVVRAEITPLPALPSNPQP